MAKKKTSKKAADRKEDLSDLSYEEAIERVEEIADKIESGEIGLEESVEQYEKGMALLNRCREILDRAELKITELTAQGDGPPEDDEEPAD